jgi:hypothetical protein
MWTPGHALLVLPLCLHLGYLGAGLVSGGRDPLTLCWLCYVSEALAVAGFALRSPLVLSVSCLPSLVVCIAWTMDVLAGSLGMPVHQTAGYLSDPQTPLHERIIPLFHIALPLFQIVALRRVGYRSRALPWTAGLLAPYLVAAWWMTAGTHHDINYLGEDWFWEPGSPLALLAPVIAWGFVMLALVLPAHAALSRWCPGPAGAAPAPDATRPST